MAAAIFPILSLVDPLWTCEDCIRWSGHPDNAVRSWALDKLESCFGKIPEDVIAERLDDPDPLVVHHAVGAICAQGLSSFTDRILAIYRRGDSIAAAACLPALILFRVPGLLDEVRTRLRSAPREERFVTWLALGDAKVPGTEALLLEALEGHPAPTPGEMSLLLTTLALTGSPTARRAAVTRLVAEYEELREGPVLDGFLDALRYGAEMGDFLEDLGPHGSREPGPLAEDTCAVLEAIWDPERLRALQKCWRKGRYGEVIARCAEGVAEIVGGPEAEGGLAGAPGLVRLLAQVRLEGLSRDAQRELAGLAMVATQESARLVRMVLTEVPAAPAEALRLLLSDDVADLPEIEERLLQLLVEAAPTPEMVGRCLETLRDPVNPAAAPAARLIGAWRPAGGVDALIAAARAADEDLVEAVTEALVQYGEAALEPLDRALADGAPLGSTMWALDVLMELPCRRSVSMVLRHFDRLWREDADQVLIAAEVLGARELIKPLRRELREGEDETAAACEFLEILHGVRTQRSISAAEEAEDAREFLRLALRCPACGRRYHYEVREILIDPGADAPYPFIRDRIRCKGCGHEGDHDLAPEALADIMAEMDRLVELEEAGEIVPEEGLPGPVRFLTMEAFGRRMNPRQGKAEYEARIAARPDDPGLRIGYGNVLSFLHLSDEALAQYQEALRLDPLAAEAQAGIAGVLEERGDLAGAIAVMERCVEAGRRAHLYHTEDRRGFPDVTRAKLEELRAFTTFHPGRRRAGPSPGDMEVEWGPREASVWERTGRNDPCPCGSGRKYKKCCLGKAQERAVPPAEPPLPADAQQRLLDRVIRFSRDLLPREAHDHALATFHGPAWDPATRTVTLAEGEDIAFLDWLVHDFRPPGVTETVIQRFHRERGHALPVAEREALEAWRNAAPGLYEVEAVEPGGGMTVADCFTGERFAIREVRGSFQLGRWDLVILRLARIEGAWRVLSAGLRFPPRAKPEALRLIREGLGELRRDRPDALPADLLRARPGLVRDLAEHVTRDLPREVYTAEGHPAVLAKALYDVRNALALLAALRGAADFQPDPNARGPKAGRMFLWLRRGPAERYVQPVTPKPKKGLQIGGQLVGPDGRAVDGLATLEIMADNTLTVDCLSRERLAWAKRRLTDLAGGALRHKADTYESLQRKLDDADEAPPPPPRTPSLEEARAAATFLYQRLKRWPDQPVPALGGRTPREAAADPATRPRLEQLLREMENAEDRKRVAGGDWLDLAWLRAELGMQ